MNEIKVGDRVRIVQIIVREDCYTGVPPAQLRHLGKEGIIKSVTLTLAQPYAVILFGDTHPTLFSSSELKVLGAPYEQQKRESPVTIRQLRKEAESLRDGLARTVEQNIHSQERVKILRAKNKRLKESVEALGDRITLLRKNIESKVQYIRRLKRKGMALREQYDKLVQESAVMHTNIIDILNSRVDTQ